MFSTKILLLKSRLSFPILRKVSSDIYRKFHAMRFRLCGLHFMISKQAAPAPQTETESLPHLATHRSQTPANAGATSPGSIGADLAANQHSSLSCPFLALPIELRLEIYRIALQDRINTVLLLCANKDFKPITPDYRGAMALLHTNRLIRAESAREMLPMVESEHSWREYRFIRLLTTAAYARKHGLSLQDSPSQEETNRAYGMKITVGYLSLMLQRCLSRSSIVDHT